MKTVYLARHGQSEWNNQRRITGRLDPGLSDRGRLQGEGLARGLEHVPVTAIYASALARTFETAKPTSLAKQLPISRLPALDEIDLGVLQGRFRDERDAEAMALWDQWQAEPWTFRVPGGERFDEFAARVVGALEWIRKRHVGECVLIVGHRATNRVLMGTLLGMPRAQWFDLRPRNKYCYRIESGRSPVVGAMSVSGTMAVSGSKTGSIIDGFVQ